MAHMRRLLFMVSFLLVFNSLMYVFIYCYSEYITRKLDSIKSQSENRVKRESQYPLPGTILATSGILFKGEIIRKFSRNKKKFYNKNNNGNNHQTNAEYEPKTRKIRYDVDVEKRSCKKWGVVTTIFGTAPSEAVRRFLYRRSNWCVVVVGDKGKPDSKYHLETSLGDNIIFLSENEQKKMGEEIDFVANMPWNSFAGRKNVGYLYAIANGAETIFDFDDDNLIKFWIEGSSPDPVLDIDNYDRFGLRGGRQGDIIEPAMKAKNTCCINPYPALGGPALPLSWPRGFPLDSILNMDTFQGNEMSDKYYKLNETKVNFAVLQSVADYQPDVDAIYRLTRKTPFVFQRPLPFVPAPAVQQARGIKSPKPKPLIRIPDSVMTPYNAQATIFFPSAFWSLYLPTTVNGRVSDIWRAYFSQALFPRIKVSLGFISRPLVVQDRNPHSYLADFVAEMDLYVKSGNLVNYLLDMYVRGKVNDIKEDTTSFVQDIEELWIDMYERGFIEEADVENIQDWILALLQLGYKFPDKISSSSVEGKLHYNSTKIRSIAQKDILRRRNKIMQLGRLINETLEVHQEKNLKMSNIQKYNKRSIHEYNPSCDSNSMLTFASADAHDGPRTDISYVLLNMNQKFLHIGPRNATRHYPQVMAMHGQSSLTSRVSPPLKLYGDPNTKLKLNWPKSNFEYYHKDSLISSVDAFICTFPASMCQLWMPFSKNKAIIFLPAHRYNLGRCTEQEWRNLNDQVRFISSSIKSLNKSTNEYSTKRKPKDIGHTIGAVSRYDLEYLKYYLPYVNLELIPSSGLYTTCDNNEYCGDYSPSSKEILIFHHRGEATDFEHRVKETLSPEFEAVFVYEKYKFYSSKDIVTHPAIVSLPYSVMSYRTSELYAMAIPIFVPSPIFYMSYQDPHSKSFGLGKDRTSTSSPYCTSDPQLEIKMRPNVSSQQHPYSPNLDLVDDSEAEMYWLQFSDFYEWPHIQLFDSLDHLKIMMLNSDLWSIHRNMKVEMRLRKKQVETKWCDVIKRIEQHKISL